MADEISKEDRALIDAAIAAGRVRVIPVGVSGEREEPLDWRAATNRTFALLKKGDKMKGVQYSRSESSLQVERTIRRLLAEGNNVSQIMAATNMTYGAVQQRIFRMGLSSKVGGKIVQDRE